MRLSENIDESYIIDDFSIEQGRLSVIRFTVKYIHYNLI